jgi:ABC-type transporter Mla subunit MlaD
MGPLHRAQRATDSIGDLAGGARGVGSELGDTLRSVREAAESIQRLTDALDTDSDMLLKGRAKGRP